MHQPKHRRAYGGKCLAIYLAALLLPGIPQGAQAHEALPRLNGTTQARTDTSPGGFADRFGFEVWMKDMSYRLQGKVTDEAQRARLLKLVYQEAHHAGLPPELVLAVIEVESDFDRWAISSSGALGLMQVMPFWLEKIGRPEDNLHNPRTNLRLGCTILRHYLDAENGNLPRALARYNGDKRSGWYPDRVLDALRVRWFRR